MNGVLAARADGECTADHAAADERQPGKHAKRGWSEDQRPHRFNLVSLGRSGRLTTVAVMPFTLCMVCPAAHRCAQRPSPVHQFVTRGLCWPPCH